MRIGICFTDDTVQKIFRQNIKYCQQCGAKLRTVDAWLTDDKLVFSEEHE